MNLLRSMAVLSVAAALAAPSMAQEAAIRESLAKNFPTMPQIDEVSKTPIAGIYEVRMGSTILYADERGEHIIEGRITDTRTQVNLTDARLDKITAIDIASLPMKDAIVWKQGTGARKLVVFADPNCGYCKKFETEMQQVKDVTVYTFLLPILGGDSPEKSKNIWCAKNNSAAWRDWMIRGTAVAPAAAACDASVLQRNLALGKKYRLTGTPALVFEDGKRVPGAWPADQVEKQLVLSRGKG